MLPTNFEKNQGTVVAASHPLKCKSSEKQFGQKQVAAAAQRERERNRGGSKEINAQVAAGDNKKNDREV